MAVYNDNTQFGGVIVRKLQDSKFTQIGIKMCLIILKLLYLIVASDLVTRKHNYSLEGLFSLFLQLQPQFNANQIIK